MRPQPLSSGSRAARPHLTIVGARAAGSSREVGGDGRFREIYERWFDEVARWLYALGVPGSDTEDLAQEIFLVVRGKLHRFDGGNLAGWIYRITQLTVNRSQDRARRCSTYYAAAP